MFFQALLVFLAGVLGYTAYLVRYDKVFRGTPAIIFASFFDMMQNVVFTFSPHDDEEYIQTEKRALSNLAKCLKVKVETVLIGSSCRAVFDNFLVVQKAFNPTKKRVLATSLMHTSFPKAIKFNDLELDLLDIDTETYQFIFDPTKYDPAAYLAVVITHAFGRAFDINTIVRWAKEHNITVFEDAVQAQMFPIYKGHPLTDIVVFSGGLDKIPSSFGGGPVLIQNNPILHKALKEQFLKFPLQTRGFRLQKLFEALSLFVVYRCTTALAIIRFFVTQILRIDVHSLVMGVRKNVSGFVHDRELYLTRPSLAGMKSIANALEKNWIVQHELMASQFKLFRSALTKEVRNKTFPWIKEGESNTLNDSCFYLHIYTPVPYKLMDFLFSKGYVVIFQQSWYDPGEGAPNSRELCKEMIILPLPFQQTKLQVETLAENLNEFHKTNS